MTARIWSGAARILASGTAISFDSGSFWIECPLDDDTVFLVQIHLTEDTTGAEPSLESGLAPHHLQLWLTNFGTPDGKGSSQPVYLEPYGEDLLYFHFRVFRHGRTREYELSYSFYRIAMADVPPGLMPAEFRGVNPPPREVIDG